MAGSSTYPLSVDNKTALQDGIDYIEADNVNNAYVPMTSTQTFIGATGKAASWSSDILDFLANMKAPQCTKASASTISVSAGAVFVKNSGQTNRMMRRNTIATTVTAADLDTGAMAGSTYYYLFAVADTAATTFTVKFSLSSTAPTGLTNFELIGWFYNETVSVLDITTGFVGGVKTNGRDVPNAQVVAGSTDITLATATFTDMTNMTIRMYCSGRPVLLLFECSDISHGGGGATARVGMQFDMDGTPYSRKQVNIDNAVTANLPSNHVLMFLLTPAAGTHTFKVQWSDRDVTSLTMGSSTHTTPRMFTAVEL